MDGRGLRNWLGGATLLVALALPGCGGRKATRIDTVFYPSPPQNPRIQFLTRYQNSRDLGVSTSGFRKFVTGETDNIETLNKPHFSVYHDKKLYICDSRRGEVVVMDIPNKEMYVLGAEESFSFGKPMGMAIADDGTRYFADNVNKRVYLFDKTDRFVRSFGEDNQFSPTSVAVFGDKLFVADVQDREVEVLNRKTGEVLTRFVGSEESQTHTFLMPANIAVDRAGNLYVSDLMSGNVHVFDSSLSFIGNIGRLGDQLGTFGRPRGVAIDSSGFVYVADASFENVQVFSPEGEVVIYFGGPGTFPGGMYLPSGVTISYDNLEVFSEYVDNRFELEYVIVVANQYGPNGVSVYGFGNGKKGYFDNATAARDTSTIDTRSTEIGED